MEPVCGGDFTTERYHISPMRAAYSRPTTSAETSDTFNAVYKLKQTENIHHIFIQNYAILFQLMAAILSNSLVELV